jgi:hypothetical protein
MSIQISHENEIRLAAAAQREGLSVDGLIERLMNEHGAPTPASSLTGAVVLAALQASPYPEIDLTPPRVRLANVREVVL